MRMMSFVTLKLTLRPFVVVTFLDNEVIPLNCLRRGEKRMRLILIRRFLWKMFEREREDEGRRGEKQNQMTNYENNQRG
eukprot:m.129653 g.129653  ORF g.129653 m.129653 type:complete len:79 (+) comp23652_c0_seq1:676-912(+)